MGRMSITRASLLSATHPRRTAARTVGSDTNAGGKLGCAHPGGGIDCTKPTDQPSVAGKVAGCTSNSNFAGCIGLRQEDHAGVGALPML